MLTTIAVLLGLILLVLALLGVVFFLGMRSKSPVILRTVRRFNRAVVNPRTLRTAGTPGAYASVVEHVGRRTGRVHRTPVDAVPTPDGFVVALPYGTTSDWVRNVLAAGTAVITDEGITCPVDRPEIVPLARMAEHFPPKDRHNLRRFHVDQCLRVRRAPA